VCRQALIKPHVVKSGDADSLTEKLRSGGFTIVARELLTLPQASARMFAWIVMPHQ
jgi:nucleoside diphosphate kinase